MGSPRSWQDKEGRSHLDSHYHIGQFTLRRTEGPADSRQARQLPRIAGRLTFSSLSLVELSS